MFDLLKPSETRSPITIDGGWGTEFQKLGIQFEGGSDVVTLSHPEEVQRLASVYARLGCKIVLTNTFGANRSRLESAGITNEIARINRLGVVLSRRGVEDRAKVMATIGPTGLHIGTPKTDFESIYSEQIEHLIDAVPDGFVIETMTNLTEAIAALETCVATGLPTVVSMTVGLGDQPFNLLSGERVEEAAVELANAGASAVGLNCMDSMFMSRGIQLMQEVIDIPIWAKPNGGIPILLDGVAFYGVTPEAFVADCMSLISDGATFVGGCCGIGPAHVGLLAATLR